jgi:hypothetical protein
VHFYNPIKNNWSRVASPFRKAAADLCRNALSASPQIMCSASRAKYLDLANLQIVAVGDAAKVRESLTKYGALESFSAVGKPVTND